MCQYDQWDNSARCNTRNMDSGERQAILSSLHSQRIILKGQEDMCAGTNLEPKVVSGWMSVPTHTPPSQIIYPERKSYHQVTRVMGASCHEMEDANHMIKVADLNVKEFTLNELRPYFNKPMTVVAKELGVCITLMKKICRKNGLVRWPHRRIRSIINKITTLEALAGNPININRNRIHARAQKLRKELSLVIENPNSKSRKAQADARVRSSSNQARGKSKAFKSKYMVPSSDSRDTLQSNSNLSDNLNHRSSSNSQSFDLSHQRNDMSRNKNQFRNFFGQVEDNSHWDAHPVSSVQAGQLNTFISKRTSNRGSILAILNESEQ